MAKSLRELFAQAGPGEHLRKLPATAARPGTVENKPGTYVRTRATKNGTLFIASASEVAFNWLGKQENREARFRFSSQNKYFTVQQSDFSRAGDRYNRKKREQRNWGEAQTDAVVQSLEAKLGSWAKVVGGDGDGGSELKALRGAVEKLEGACKKGFSENVAATKEVGDKVDTINQSVIDLTDETKEYLKAHKGISEEILKSFGNANRALAKLLASKATPEKAAPRGVRIRAREYSTSPASTSSMDHGGGNLSAEEKEDARELRKARVSPHTARKIPIDSKKKKASRGGKKSLEKTNTSRGREH
ncbi:hypothetical protein CYMTET_39497 [Cymbomonas tetramitiformis]|uniref:Uncharacterized protein n=1 Tax=Cymbomonas tetramitiformis TaxID=36881 RepID=A0AAE0F4F3_9CHLO|nr:hypothetical protein CYMTET_39497 [Cymbomonas tetramitiformis]